MQLSNHLYLSKMYLYNPIFTLSKLKINNKKCRKQTEKKLKTRNSTHGEPSTYLGDIQLA